MEPMNKNELKQEALRLREKGLTYSEISSALDGAFSVDQCKKYLKGVKPKPMQNEIRQQFIEHWYGKDEGDTWPVWIDDIVSGVARLDWYGDREQQIPLATTKIIKCYLWLEEFTTENIMELLEAGRKMAQRYLKACQLCYPFFKKSLANFNIWSMHYPRQSIVSVQQGLDLGYSPYHTKQK